MVVEISAILAVSLLYATLSIKSSINFDILSIHLPVRKIFYVKIILTALDKIHFFIYTYNVSINKNEEG